MKTDLTCISLLVFLTCAFSVTADGNVQACGPADENTLLGVWHAQVGGTEDDPVLYGVFISMQMHFDDDGKLHVLTKLGNEEEDQQTQPYTYDEQKATISIYSTNNEGKAGKKLEKVMQYSFVDEMLVLRFNERGEEIGVELTRQAEGTERHQMLRADHTDTSGAAEMKARDLALLTKSMSNMREIGRGALAYTKSNANANPSSLGELAIRDFITPASILSPSSNTEIPKDFDDWSDQKKSDWMNESSDYVYLLADKKKQQNAEEVAVFELPNSVNQAKVIVLFGEVRLKAIEYAKADKLIKKQTGYTIEQWMNTKSPGSGEAPDDEKKSEEAE